MLDAKEIALRLLQWGHSGGTEQDKDCGSGGDTITRLLRELARLQEVANTQTECVLDAEDRRAETIAMCAQLRSELDAMRNLVDRAVKMFYFACPEVRADGLMNHNNPVLKWFADAKSALVADFANDLVKTWVASGDATIDTPRIDALLREWDKLRFEYENDESAELRRLISLARELEREAATVIEACRQACMDEWVHADAPDGDIDAHGKSYNQGVTDCVAAIQRIALNADAGVAEDEWAG